MESRISVYGVLQLFVLCIFGTLKLTISLRMPTIMTLSEKIRSALTVKFPPNDVGRIVKTWDRFCNADLFEKNLDDAGDIVQKADCYVEGLTPRCFHDMNDHPWALGLESHYTEILSELKEYDEKQLQLELLNNAWLPPRDTTGSAYGPEWRTLGLQDRSVWDEDRSQYFPKTVSILNDLKVPSVEVFFAKQGPNSGILPHSDRNNFIITCHLGLEVPEGLAWIKVGKDKYYWKNGKSVVFDTSIVHSTMNESPSPRLVLLIRFWHPELTTMEREALKFIFDYLDHSAAGEEALQLFELKHLFQGKDKPAAEAGSKEKAGAGVTVAASNTRKLSSSNEKGKSSNKQRADLLSAGGGEDDKKKTNKPKPKGFGSR